ncbi:MAG TPA: lytic transglycosylase domain-containing protein [Myxococcaceae bacterium]|nr:lytic transglycosylase domain-containing protein [Myxococcaceae bacterium]
MCVLSARIGPMLQSDVPPAPPEAARTSDAAKIDSVLAKRAPELGLTLRGQLCAAIAEEARRAGFDPLLVVAIIDVESDFDEDAVSVRGARGLMQIKPSTLHDIAGRQGLKLTAEEVAADPALQVRLGIRYLKQLHQSFGGDLDLALMAYNAGPTRLRKAMKASDGEVESFRRYARLVRRDFRRFRQGEGLGDDWAMAAKLPQPR